MANEEDDKRSEMESLRAENEALKVKLAQGQMKESSSARTRWSLVLAVVAALLVTLSVPALWLNRVVLDTDGWVETVAPLASDPAVQDAVSAAAAGALIEQIDSRGVAERYLPGELALFAGPISQAVDDFVRAGADEVVRSDQFAELWTEMNRTGHAAIVAAITGRTGVVSVEAGVVTLDTGVLADHVRVGLLDRGLGFAESIPVARLSRQIVLFRSPLVAELAGVFDAIDRAAFVMPMLALLIAVAAVVLSTDRRRVFLWLGAGIVVAGAVPLQAIYLGQTYGIGQIQMLGESGSAAAQAIYQTVFRDLVVAEQSLAFLGVVVWLSAVLAGPSKWAEALRSGLSGGLSQATRDLDLGAFGSWASARTTVLRSVGAGIAFIVLLGFPPPRTVGQILWVALGTGVWFIAVEVVRSAQSGDAGFEEG